jgi:NAD-dependent deacetylase
MRLEISRFKRIVVLTGAGISAESGISTFRDSGGLWERHRIEDVATPEAFERDPVLVWRFYSMRRVAAGAAQPNLAHQTLAAFAERAAGRGTRFTLVTQNVDMLHERSAASVNASSLEYILEMHGSLAYSRCNGCGKIYSDPYAWFDESGERTTRKALNPQESPARHAPTQVAITAEQIERESNTGIPLSPCCRLYLRPHIVWFGEMPLRMDLIQEELDSCDLFVAIGTSGQVYPAAGFIAQAKIAGAVTALLNMEPIWHREVIDFYLEGPATHTVPAVFGS